MSLGITKQEKLTVGVLLAGTFIAVLNATLLTPALPTIMRDLGVESTTVQWLTSGYALTEAVVIPLAAYIMGRLTTRQLYIGGIGLFCAGSVLAAFSPAFPLLLAGRVMQAAATGAVMPMVMSTILLIFPREKRGSAMGIIGLLIGFAPAIGPSLSGLLIDSIGWRAIFVVVAVLALAIVLVSAVVLKNTDNFKRTKFDFLSVVLSTVGLLSLLYGLSTFSSAENHAITAALIIVGLVILAVYVRRQLKLEQPMLRVSILSVPQYRTVVIVIMIFQGALIGMETVMPLYIQGTLGMSATVSGIALLPGALIGAVVGFFAGRLFDKHGVRGPVLVGGVGIVLAAVGLTQLQVASPILLVTLIYTVLAIGMQFTMTPLNTWGVNSLPNDAIQHAQSTSNTLNQVAGSFGTALLVSVSAAVASITVGVDSTAQTFAGYHASFSVTAGLVCVAVLIIVVFVRDKKGAVAGAGAGAARGGEAGLGLARQGAEGAVAGAGAGVDSSGVAASSASAGAEGSSTPAGAASVGAASSFAPAADEAAGVAGGEDAASVAVPSVLRGTVEDAMNKQAATVRESDAMEAVVRIMASTDTSGVSVVNDAGKLVGYVTDGDVAKYLARRDASIFSPHGNMFTYYADDESFANRLQDLAKVNVMELATKNVITLDAQMPLEKACALFAERRIKKAPVVENGVLQGALSRRNIMHYMMDHASE